MLIDMEKLVSLLEISFVTRGDIPFWDISKPKSDGFWFNMGHFIACEHRHLLQARAKPEGP